MALNITSSGNASYLPFAKYNAKSGRWYLKKDGVETEVEKPTFVADFDNIKTGFFLFAEGMAPSIVLDQDLDTPAAKPSDKHKRGFKMELFSNQSFGGVVEFSASSMHVCNAISDLYNKYEAGKAENAGKLPVVSFTGHEAKKDKQGVNYAPLFSIVKWVDRPVEFASAKQQAAPVAAANTVQQAPATAKAAVSEF